MIIEKEQIIESIKRILVDKIDVCVPIYKIDTEAGFASVLGVDSIGFIELRYQCEDIFKIQITDEDFTPTNFTSCSSLATFVAERMAAF